MIRISGPLHRQRCLSILGRSSRLSARTQTSWRPGTQQTLFLYQRRHTHSSLITLALRPPPNGGRGASAEEKVCDSARWPHVEQPCRLALQTARKWLNGF